MGSLEDAIGKQVKAHMQKALDSVYRSHKGKPAADVKKAIKKVLPTELVEPHLSQMADAISGGDKPKIK